MPVEEGKVKAALDAKFKGKSITKNFKESLAKTWAPKIETDEEIDAYINDREDVILEAMRDKDSAVTAAVTKTKQEAADALTGKPKPETEPATPELPADTPEWAKALLKQNQDLAAKVEGFEKSKQAESITDRFKKDERIKDIPDFIKSGYIPTSDADYEEKVTGLQTKFTEWATEKKLSVFGGDTPPGGAPVAGAGGKVKLASDESVDKVLAQI